jgi:hypothetical protein
MDHRSGACQTAGKTALLVFDNHAERNRLLTRLRKEIIETKFLSHRQSQIQQLVINAESYQERLAGIQRFPVKTALSKKLRMMVRQVAAVGIKLNSSGEYVKEIIQVAVCMLNRYGYHISYTPVIRVSCKKGVIPE